MLRSNGNDEPTRGSATSFRASEALAAIVGDAPLTRAEATSRLWDYIRANGLQDANDKRQIIADEALAKVFGADRASMFEIARHLNAHLR
jgi:DNA topoisomerase III